MKRLMLLALLLFAVPLGVSAQVTPSSVQATTAAKARLAEARARNEASIRAGVRSLTCCDAGQLATIMDLNYIARASLNHTGPLVSRLYQMNMAIGEGRWMTFEDPNRSELLGAIAATGDGIYWRSLIDAFAIKWGVTVGGAPTPTPTPVPVPTPTPTPTPAPSPVINMPVKPAICPLPAGRTVTTAKLATCLAYESARADSLVKIIARLQLAGAGSGPAPAPTQVVTNTAYPDLISVGNGELTFIARDNGGNRQEGPAGRIGGDFKTLFGMNGYDGGARILQNWNHNGTKYLPYSTIGMDSRGAVSFNWFPAELGGEYRDNAPASVHSDPNHPLYAPYRGQFMVIDGGSQTAYDYSTGAPLYNGRNVLVAAQRAGQSMYFAVSPDRQNGYPLNRAVMKLRSDWNPNPVEVVIDGTLRQLKSCNVGGQTVVCF